MKNKLLMDLMICGMILGAVSGCGSTPAEESDADKGSTTTLTEAAETKPEADDNTAETEAAAETTATEVTAEEGENRHSSDHIKGDSRNFTALAGTPSVFGVEIKRGCTINDLIDAGFTTDDDLTTTLKPNYKGDVKLDFTGDDNKHNIFVVINPVNNTGADIALGDAPIDDFSVVAHNAVTDGDSADYVFPGGVQLSDDIADAYDALGTPRNSVIRNQGSGDTSYLDCYVTAIDSDVVYHFESDNYTMVRASFDLVPEIY